MSSKSLQKRPGGNQVPTLRKLVVNKDGPDFKSDKKPDGNQENWERTKKEL